jgi:hypothetical protein
MRRAHPDDCALTRIVHGATMFYEVDDRVQAYRPRRAGAREGGGSGGASVSYICPPLHGGPTNATASQWQARPLADASAPPAPCVRLGRIDRPLCSELCGVHPFRVARPDATRRRCVGRGGPNTTALGLRCHRAHRPGRHLVRQEWGRCDPTKWGRSARDSGRYPTTVVIEARSAPTVAPLSPIAPGLPPSTPRRGPAGPLRLPSAPRAAPIEARALPIAPDRSASGR